MTQRDKARNREGEGSQPVRISESDRHNGAHLKRWLAIPLLFTPQAELFSISQYIVILVMILASLRDYKL